MSDVQGFFCQDCMLFWRDKYSFWNGYQSTCPCCGKACEAVCDTQCTTMNTRWRAFTMAVRSISKSTTMKRPRLVWKASATGFATRSKRRWGLLAITRSIPIPMLKQMRMRAGSRFAGYHFSKCILLALVHR
jgi:hypothetical protein